jgi:hypothetical protein
MQKRAHFANHRGWGWPRASDVEHYFLAPPGQEWFYDGGNDAAALRIQGVHGTEHLGANKGRIDVTLEMWGHPEHGVLLIYSRWGGGYKENYSSKGDLSRLREWVRSLHATPLPVGLFIPFREAWKAVKEFMETDGELPKSIAWIANKDLPPNTFPDP